MGHPMAHRVLPWARAGLLLRAPHEPATLHRRLQGQSHSPHMRKHARSCRPLMPRTLLDALPGETQAVKAAIQYLGDWDARKNDHWTRQNSMDSQFIRQIIQVVSDTGICDEYIEDPTLRAYHANGRWPCSCGSLPTQITSVDWTEEDEYIWLKSGGLPPIPDKEKHREWRRKFQFKNNLIK